MSADKTSLSPPKQ